MPLSDLTTTNNIVGGTDGTAIGNVGDRLKVDSIISPQTTSFRKFSYDDATLARGTSVNPTSWVTTYEYTGSGLVYGFLMNLEGASGAEGSRWYFDLLIDNAFSVFGTNGMLFSDLTDGNIYDSLSGTDSFCGVNTDTNLVKVDFQMFPIYFSSNIKTRVRRITSSKKFRAGLIKISKD